jgi:hypothetical protein
MAVLGIGGRLLLRREAPKAIVVSPNKVHLESNSLAVDDRDFWTGDLVTINSDRGVPFLNTSNIPQCPDGCATYFGSDWYLASNRSHIGNGQQTFYKTSDTASFYTKTPVSNSATYYVYRDQLDRLSFYTTHAASLQGSRNQRVPLTRVDWGAMIIAPSGTTDYDNLVLTCAGDIGDYRFSDVQDEITLDSICDYAPDYQSPIAGVNEYDNAEVQPRERIPEPMWQVMGNLRGWTLDLNANSVDVTAVGEKFGESVKSLVTGGGNIDFEIDRKARGIKEADTNMLLQLLTMTEKGCAAEAQFWMINRTNAEAGLLAGDLYYFTKLLITNVAINLRPADIVAGTANFVTTGSIALRQGTN